ncbi:hypothetical protein CSB37_03825 [bacterium DOLZORAL124_38_8]|nr:MAG: hypothetical protein CSB37_03825 [bacterium DOLZORAL124_38_8]
MKEKTIKEIRKEAIEISNSPEAIKAKERPPRVLKPGESVEIRTNKINESTKKTVEENIAKKSPHEELGLSEEEYERFEVLKTIFSNEPIRKIINNLQTGLSLAESVNFRITANHIIDYLRESCTSQDFQSIVDITSRMNEKNERETLKNIFYQHLRTGEIIIPTNSQ